MERRVNATPLGIQFEISCKKSGNNTFLKHGKMNRDTNDRESDNIDQADQTNKTTTPPNRSVRDL